ncbi:MAG: hypothetical protein AAB353_05670 [Candidatus Hydrogenedentota bacterium]
METNTPPTFLTVTQYAKKHAYPSVLGLRHLIFNAATNGFPVRRLGRRVLLREDEVLAWIDSQSKPGRAA